MPKLGGHERLLISDVGGDDVVGDGGSGGGRGSGAANSDGDVSGAVMVVMMP